MGKRRSAWRIWAKALGQKEGRSDKEADIIAIIRTLIMIQLVITNGFIIANAVRHWNNVPERSYPPYERSCTEGDMSKYN